MSIPIEAISMNEAGSGQAAQSTLPWQDILDKMADPELDAFQRMKIAMYELFPAITADKEENLTDLADTFEEMVTLQEDLEEIQNMFNVLKNGSNEEIDGAKYVEALENLENVLRRFEYMEEPPMDPEFAAQLADELQVMRYDIQRAADQNNGNIEVAIQKMWNSYYGSDSTQPAQITEEQIGQLKTQLDGFNDVGNGISGFSSSLQNELQFEIANYQQMLATQDGIYREDMNTTKAHVSKLAPR